MKQFSQPATLYYAHADHLGSIVSLTDSAGVAVFKASNDACSVKLAFCERSETKSIVEQIPISGANREGKQTVSLNTIGFYRGYTGHACPPYGGSIWQSLALLI